MSNIWHDIDPKRITPEDFIAVIEISKGSKKNMSWTKLPAILSLIEFCTLRLTIRPNYGFIPRTYADDKDPLDVLVLCSEALEPMSLVRCYPIGVIVMQDGGKMDEKIVAIPMKDPNYNAYHNINELPRHVFSEMEHFFTVYKNLEGKNTVVDEAKDREAALEVIEKCLDNYVETFCR